MEFKFDSIEVKTMALGRALELTFVNVADLVNRFGYDETYGKLLDIRSRKVKECGDWMADKIDIAFYLVQVDILKVNPQEQKKAWHALRLWLSNHDLHQWEEHYDDEFGDRILDKEDDG